MKLIFRLPKKQAPRPKARLPGEKHSFKDLVPPQYYRNGQIVSSRSEEVTREDPTLARIRRLEEALRQIASVSSDPRIQSILKEVLK